MKAYYFLFTASIFLLSGCGPRGEQIMIQNAKGAEYSTGYSDGCESGRKAAGIESANSRQDLILYANNKSYKKGWDTGYKECKFREERVAKLN